MTVGRAISPECSTDERREWQKGAAAFHLVTPTDWLARIAHDPQHVCDGQLGGCGCFLPHLLVDAAGRSLGSAGSRPLSPVSVHRAIAVDRNPRALRSVSGSLVPQYGTARSAQRSARHGTIFVDQEIDYTTKRE